MLSVENINEGNYQETKVGKKSLMVKK